MKMNGMKTLRLHVHPDTVLRTLAQPLNTLRTSHRRLLENMLQAMRTWGGIGLAAPQVGISQRMITVEADGECLALVNPVILAGEGAHEMVEGCLSLPGQQVRVARRSVVWVQAYDHEHRLREFKCQGLLARVIQHELDHLDGILIIDHGPVICHTTP